MDCPRAQWQLDGVERQCAALQPLLYPLADHRALELGERAHQLEQLEIREEEEEVKLHPSMLAGFETHDHGSLDD